MIIRETYAGAVAPNTNYDVVIYGATWAGICAAVEASKFGQRVALVEPTPYLGGMVAHGGLNLLDIERLVMGGCAWQMVQRVTVLEGINNSGAPTLLRQSTGALGQANTWVAQPPPSFTTMAAKNWETVFWREIQLAGIDLFLNAPLSTIGGSLTGSVITSGSPATISAIRTDAGTFYGRQFIDASYEGDLIIQSGCAYTYGVESSSSLSPTITQGYNACSALGYGESLAGFNSTTQATFAGATFISAGNAVFPLVNNPGLSAGAGFDKVQAYSFRTTIMLISNGGIAFDKPAGYNSADYATVDMCLSGKTTLAQAVLQVPMNSNKVNLNGIGGAAISNDLPNGSDGYPTGTPSQRRAIYERHVKWCKGLLYFLANDSTNTTLKANAALYGYPPDEYTDNGGFPRLMYVREGVRLIGQEILKQPDIDNTSPTKSNSIALTVYQHIDNHGSLTYPTSNTTIVRASDLYASCNGGDQIPMGCVMPRRADVRNLLVPINASVSHVAWSVFRLEPLMAQVGAACGMIAYLANKNNIAVQDVAYADLSQLFTNVGHLS